MYVKKDRFLFLLCSFAKGILNFETICNVWDVDLILKIISKYKGLAIDFASFCKSSVVQSVLFCELIIPRNLKAKDIAGLVPQKISFVT